MKYLITLITLASLAAIGYGLYIQGTEPYAEKMIGFGTAGLFLVAMPLFIFSRSKGRSMKDYMLTEESIEAMRIQEKDSRAKTKSKD